MPLQVSNESPDVLAEHLRNDVKPSFLVVYASLVDGRSWCGDCRNAEKFVNQVLGEKENVVKVVYAGVKEEWRDSSNIWRQEPFSIKKLPTVIKVSSEGKWERLEEEDVYTTGKLEEFVRGT